MELKVEEIKALEPIRFNYEEIKSQLQEQLKKYKGVVYTEEMIAQAKTDKATVRKVKDAINDEKKRIKNLLLADYTVNFEPKCKELMEMLENVYNEIDTQVKAFEEKEKQDKKFKIIDVWVKLAGRYAQIVDFDIIFQEQWLNKTYSMNKVEEDLKAIVVRTERDFETINQRVTDKEINELVTAFYLEHLDKPETALTLTLAEEYSIKERRAKVNSFTNSTQSVIKSEENPTETSQNLTQNGNLQIIDFRVEATTEQLKSLKAFLINNKIKFGPVPKK